MPPHHYRTHAQAYFDATHAVDMSPVYQRLLPHVRKGGRILDAGCGSGRDAQAFARLGFEVEAFDASPELAALAAAHTGLNVQVMGFEQVTWQARFDAVWACASLLHVPAKEQPACLSALLRAIMPGGVLYASYKLGDTDHVDVLQRPFTNATEARFTSWLGTAQQGWVLDHWITGDQRANTQQAWFNVLVQHPHEHDQTTGSPSGN
jgi:SAM-dependent methyltransferase